jgi:Uma2 family endonuclease
MSIQLERHRFTVEEYHRMAEAGILKEDARVELIEGEIYEMTPISPRHAGHVIRLNTLLTARLSDRVLVSVQNPVVLDKLSEPQPDLTVLRPRPDFYTESHPEPVDIFLVIEVSEVPAIERRLKLGLYARTGVREVWLVNLQAGRIEVYRGPGPDGYREYRALEWGQSLATEAFPDLPFTVDEILG